MNTKLFDSVSVIDSQEAVESKWRLQAVFNNALDSILMTDEDMRFVDANPAACALTSYDREELLKLRIQDITPLSNQSLLDEMWQNLISAGRLDGEYQLQPSTQPSGQDQDCLGLGRYADSSVFFGNTLRL